MIAIGIDLGFGVTKWACNGRRGSFDSAWCPHPDTARGWGLGGGPTLTVDGVRVITGTGAASRPDTRHPLADGRLADPEALPLLAAALWDAGAEGDVTLGSGPPLGAFATERDAARAALEGRTLHLVSGGQERTVHIVRLVLRPQGVGAALHLMARGLLPAQAGYGVIIDVGTRTTDVLTVSLRDVSPVMALCCSFGLGLATAARDLSAAAQHRTGHLPPFGLAMVALREPQPWAGGVIGGDDALCGATPYLASLAASIRREVQRLFGDQAEQVAALALVGGGAALLGDRLRGALADLPGREVPLRTEDQLYANALGFAWAAATAVAAQR